MKSCATAIALVVVAACASSPAETRVASTSPGNLSATALASPVGVEDIHRLGFVSELEVAPDGHGAFYVWTRPEAKSDSFASRLHHLDLTRPAREPRALTPENVDVSTVRFSPDGRFLAWLESDDDSTALSWAAVKRDGIGAANIALDIKEGLDDFAWAPDGERFVIVRTDPAHPSPPAPPAASKAKSSPPWVITRTQIRRDGEGFLDDRRDHLWIVARQGGRPARQISSGAWDDSSPAWSPDGKSIAFVSNRSSDPDRTDNTDLFVISPEGGEVSTLVTGPGAESEPSWSHRGDRLAFHSLRRADDYYQPQRVMTVAASGGEPIDLTGALDAWVASDALAAGKPPAPPLWSADDRELSVLFERRGATWIGLVDSATGAAREVAGGRFVHGLVRDLPGESGRLFTRTDPTHPPELYRQPRAGGEPARLTRFYESWLAERRLSTPEKIVAKNSAGDDVEAWLYPPLDPPAAGPGGGKAPLIVYIHGGPQLFDGDHFDFDLENQLFAGRGWGVLRVNYRGSTSYGEAFSRSIWGDWHWREYEDLMAALDLAIATRPWIDPERLGIGGWSYGGIMTLWAVGHTDRFRVGVPERLSFDYLSSFGEDQWFVWLLSELGSPLENADLYRRLSPGSYVGNVKTPLYLIANERDYNCPLPQAMQLYQRLKLQGQKTELVVYPGESHSMSSPAHLADRLRRLLVWFGRHLGD